MKLSVLMAIPALAIAFSAHAGKQNTYVIERNIENAGELTAEELRDVARTSSAVLDDMGPEITWLHSYVTDDKVYCVYQASSEELIREHAKKGGFPADRITALSTVIDPSTAE